MKLFTVIFALLAIQQTLAQNNPGDWSRDRILSLRAMIKSSSSLFSSETSSLYQVSLILQGNLLMVPASLKSLAASGLISATSKKNLLAYSTLLSKQLTNMQDLVKNSDDSMSTIVIAKLEELAKGLDLVYLDIDIIFTSQFLISSPASMKISNCATSVGDMQVYTIWMKKYQEIQDMIMNINDPMTASMSLQNPILMNAQKMGENFTAALNLCLGAPSDKCVADLIAQFPLTADAPLGILKKFVAEKISDIKKSLKTGLTYSIKNGLLQSDALRKSVAGCLIYFPIQA